MLNFFYLRSSRLTHFWLDSCIVNKGEKFELEMACCTHLEGFQVVSSYFWALAVSQVASAWPVKGTGLTGVVPRCWTILSTGLTGEGDWSDRWELSWCSCSVSCGGSHAFVQGELHWFWGSLHVCRGSTLWFFDFWFGGLCSLLELCFVSDVSSRCPCLRGQRLVFFRWSFSLPKFGFRSLVGVSFYSFLFFLFSLVLQFVGVVNALIKGEIEDHVWFEDRWMVASFCDEWLTTLCGLILG
jgi:hypothetical protein